MRVASSVRTTRTTAFMSLGESPVSALSHNASWSQRLVMALTGSVWQTNQFSAGTGRDDEPCEVRGKLAHALLGWARRRGAAPSAEPALRAKKTVPLADMDLHFASTYYYYY